MIVPTVGRVVWYAPHISEYIAREPSQPLAAIVAYVHSDTKVNLMVIDSNGVPQARQGVKLLQDYDYPASGEACCMWMPYQVGQAKKYEELEAQKVKAQQDQAVAR